jgi:hypothetical protein
MVPPLENASLNQIILLVPATLLVANHCSFCSVGNGHKDLDQQKNNTARKDKPAAEPIVVPIVLRMSDFDHKVYALTAL